MTQLNFEIVFGWLAAATAAGPPPTIADLPPLKTGDVVFQTTTGNQSLAIMTVSRSQYTHMGILEIDGNGKPVVVEAFGPVRVTPFEEWIKRGVGGRLTVKRVKGLSEADAQSALAKARKYLGRPYDPYFYETTDAIYCSELVHLAYKEGPSLSVGTEEKVGTLSVDNAAVRKLIKERWKKHPACQSKENRKFDNCYEIILNQTLVTPASIARDPKVETIYSNFGAGAE